MKPTNRVRVQLDQTLLLREEVPSLPPVECLRELLLVAIRVCNDSGGSGRIPVSLRRKVRGLGIDALANCKHTYGLDYRKERQ